MWCACLFNAFACTQCASMLLSSRKVFVLVDPQGPIYKSVSLSSDHKSLSLSMENKILKYFEDSTFCNVMCDHISGSKPWFFKCCCPRGKSLSSKIHEDQFTSPCPWPRTSSPCPCSRTTSSWALACHCHCPQTLTPWQYHCWYAISMTMML